MDPCPATQHSHQDTGLVKPTGFSEVLINFWRVWCFVLFFFLNKKRKGLFSINVFETKILAAITTRGTMGKAAGQCSAESWGLSGFNITYELCEYSWFLYLCTASLANEPV